MKRFYERAADRISKIDPDQLRRVFQLLSSENDLLAMVLDSMARGIIVTGTTGNILLINRAAERLIRLNTSDYLEHLVWEVVSDTEIATFLYDTLNSEDTAYDKEFTVDSSSLKVLSFGVLPLVSEGHVAGNLINIEDITEKRANSSRLRRAESLAALATLTAGVAHEIKNPLAAIGIHLQLIQRRFNNNIKMSGEGSWQAVIEAFEVIEEEVDRLNQIVVDYLFAVRPMNANLQSGNVNDILNELLRFLQPELDEAKIQVRKDLPKIIPNVLFDQRHLREALLNVIKNSIAAMQENTDSKNSNILSISTKVDGDALVVSLGDNGPGIPEEIQSKIFEPYFTTRDFGSGLGLTLVYKIVKEHLGEIILDSKLGVGSVFSIRLPIPQSEQHLLGFQEK